jgi:hypothetical protein
MLVLALTWSSTPFPRQFFLAGVTSHWWTLSLILIFLSSHCRVAIVWEFLLPLIVNMSLQVISWQQGFMPARLPFIQTEFAEQSLYHQDCSQAAQLRILQQSHFFLRLYYAWSCRRDWRNVISKHNLWRIGLLWSCRGIVFSVQLLGRKVGGRHSRVLSRLSMS